MEDMAAIMVVIMEVVGVIGRYWVSRWSTATSRIWSKVQTLLKIIDLERKDSLCYCQKELELIWDWRCKASCRKARQNSLKKGHTHTYPAWLYGIKNPTRLWILEPAKHYCSFFCSRQIFNHICFLSSYRKFTRYHICLAQK